MTPTQIQAISIHAPREGGDYMITPSLPYSNISIHAPREGGDMLWLKNLPPFRKFQSTPPARGATVYFFSQTFDIDISIHAPREGGDPQ